MKYEEYQNIINSIISSPEKAPETAKTLLDAIKQDTELIDSQNSKISEQDSKIKDLQDTNIKLFLSQTSKPVEVKEEKTLDITDFGQQILGRS